MFVSDGWFIGFADHAVELKQKLINGVYVRVLVRIKHKKYKKKLIKGVSA